MQELKNVNNHVGRTPSEGGGEWGGGNDKSEFDQFARSVCKRQNEFFYFVHLSLRSTNIV